MLFINLGVNSSPVFRVMAQNGHTHQDSLEKLSTGSRINRASDDPAGLVTSENFKKVLALIESETRSLQRTDHVVNTADGALGEISGLLNEAEALAVANASDGLSDAEREANQMELDSIMSTIDRLSAGTTFNGDPLLDGSLTVSAAGTSQSVDSVSTGDLGEVEVDGSTYRLSDVAAGGALNIVDGDVGSAQASIRAASNRVASIRGELGAFSRHTVQGRMSALSSELETVASANSAIRDTDFAAETANLVRSQILLQAGLSSASTLLSTQKSFIVDLFG